jgi:hypothetical protein
MVFPADAALPADAAMTSDAEFPPDASDHGDLPRRSRGRSASRSGPAPFDVFGSPDAAAFSSPPGSPFGTASSSPGSYTTEPPPFPAWQDAGDAGAADAPTDPAPARNGSEAGAPRISKPPWELSPDSGPLPVIPGTVEPTTADETEPNGDGLSDDGYKGLPRRVKQASIAPQLRGEPPTRLRPAPASASAPTQDLGGAGQHGGRSPAEMRATMSSLQRGWQAGRSESAAAGEPPWESDHATEGDTDGA